MARRVSPVTTPRRWSPLRPSLRSRRRASTRNSSGAGSPSVNCNVAHATAPDKPQSPCNMHIGKDFIVKIKKYFDFIKLLNSNSKGGILTCEFNPLMPLNGMQLSNDAEKIRTVPNAGGNSVMSESLSFEMFGRCFGARLLKTEMEVEYFPEGGSITDYVCSMFDITLGVSVTRAMKYRGHYTEEDAHKLLEKKLTGVIQSSHNTLENWSKQILHIWATSSHVADTVSTAYSAISDNVRANTVVVITVAANANYIFANS